MSEEEKSSESPTQSPKSDTPPPSKDPSKSSPPPSSNSPPPPSDNNQDKGKDNNNNNENKDNNNKDDNQDKSPPPPPPENNTSPPPPAEKKNDAPPPENKDNNNNNNNNSSSSAPPPPPQNDNKSSPPPPNNAPAPPQNESNNNTGGNDGGKKEDGNNGGNAGQDGNKDDNKNTGSSGDKNPMPPSGNNTSGSTPSTTPSPPGVTGSNSPSSNASETPKLPSGSSSNKGSSGDDSNKEPLIGGVAVGAGLLVLFFVAFAVVCMRRKQKKKQNHMYYGDPFRGGGMYQTGPHGAQNWQNGNIMSQEHTINLPPPPGGAGFPPPPPIMVSSGEMSSGFPSPHGHGMAPQQSNMGLGFSQSQFSYEELAAATQGFSKANLLGQGGFGFVHKAVLPNGKVVAVKSLKSGSGQGDREFRAEVEIITRVHHRHLVSLVGYCISNGQKMLVYEFVPNNTLEHHLHGGSATPLDWSQRLKIALGSARGLAYLHEDCHPRIIHRDIKASNILLDETFEAQVADFGLAKLSDNNYTHVSTRVMGTFGYMAPEYASSGKLTDKSDVFSFGVMLLELITGRRPIDLTGNMEDSLVDWARPLCVRALEDGNYEPIADPRLEGNYVPHEMARMVACAAASIRHSARRRPKMSQIVRALEGDSSLEDLNDGMKPGQSGPYGHGGSDQDGSTYNDEMKKFRQMAFGSGEYTSSEYGATSEYGLNPSASSTDTNFSKNASRRQNP